MAEIATVRVAHPEHEEGILKNVEDLLDDDVIVDAKAEKARRKQMAKNAADAQNEGALSSIKQDTGLDADPTKEAN